MSFAWADPDADSITVHADEPVCRGSNANHLRRIGNRKVGVVGNVVRVGEVIRSNYVAHTNVKPSRDCGDCLSGLQHVVPGGL